ncbi:hypothetical protein ACE02G_20050 [Shewanella xiamenensis]|uniref:hypothetical protein n=1 Tax=Shewanella xiamenensis TaxID=332186 RepID=UPI0035BA2ADE
MIPDFDSTAEVAKLRAQTKAIRKRNYSQRRSVLDVYKGELCSMYKDGARGTELVRWLKSKKISVAHSTVLRYVKKQSHG